MTEEVKLQIDDTFNLEEKTPFGKRWGGEQFILTEADLQHLQSGKRIALDVMAEYVVYLKIEK